jgi:sec-independent protein translocase protein TatC
MPLAAHLSELRSRILKSVAAILAATIVAFVFRHAILHFLTAPYCNLPVSRLSVTHDKCGLVVSGVTQAFTVTLKICLYVGIVGSSPVWLWQLWRFITPGLHQNERRWALIFVGGSLSLFAVGGVLAYITMNKGLEFLLSFASGGLTPLLQVDSYLSYVTSMLLVFGVSFEFPLVLILLNLIGMLPYARLRHWWRPAIFVIFVFAAVATPSQDPFTMSALSLPMCLLYGVALVVARAHDARKARRQATDVSSQIGDDELSPLDLDSV